MLPMSPSEAVGYCVCCPHLWSEDQSQDDCGPDEEPSTEHGCKNIDQILQRVGGDNDHCQNNAGDVDGCQDVLGVV